MPPSLRFDSRVADDLLPLVGIGADDVAEHLWRAANRDGAQGLARIPRHGGLRIVQDPAEAAVSTMPEAAIALHAPDHILRLREIHALLTRMGTPHAA